MVFAGYHSGQKSGKDAGQKKMRLLRRKSLTPKNAVLKIFHKPGMFMTKIRMMKPAPVRPSIS